MIGRARVCASCHATVCPVCRQFGGTHRKKQHRAPRPRFNRVTRSEIDDVIMSVFRTGYYIASSIVGNDLDMIVDSLSGAAESMLKAREYLRSERGLKTYYLTSVRREALDQLCARARRPVPVDPADLDALMMREFEREHGRRILPHLSGASGRPRDE